MAGDFLGTFDPDKFSLTILGKTILGLTEEKEFKSRRQLDACFDIRLPGTIHKKTIKGTIKV